MSLLSELQRRGPPLEPKESGGSRGRTQHHFGWTPTWMSKWKLANPSRREDGVNMHRRQPLSVCAQPRSGYVAAQILLNLFAEHLSIAQFLQDLHLGWKLRRFRYGLSDLGETNIQRAKLLHDRLAHHGPDRRSQLLNQKCQRFTVCQAHFSVLAVQRRHRQPPTHEGSLLFSIDGVYNEKNRSACREIPDKATVC